MTRFLALVAFLTAIIFKSSGTEPAAMLLRQARQAMLDYDFTTASARYTAYQTALRKNKQPVDSSAMRESSSIARLRQALETVEDVIVIDSITIPLTSASGDSAICLPDRGELLSRVLETIKLPPSAGRLTHAGDFPFITRPDAVAGAVFITPDGNTAIYSATGPEGPNVLYEASRMADGSWQTEPIADIPAPAYSPFMLDDGMTLYYTSDGNTSLGGRDVMVSVRDAITEPWRTPRNLGMPFNSPAHELLLAIDTNDSIGWLVTTRNSLDADTATLYLFIPSDNRRNLVLDDNELRARAKITDISATWPDDFNPDDILATLNDIGGHGKEIPVTENEFNFPLPDGNVLRTLAQIKDIRVRKTMQEYQTLTAKLSEAEADLGKMYEDYGQGNRHPGQKARITDAEIDLDYLRADCQRKRNKVLRALGFR